MDARTSPEGLSHRLRTLAAAAAVLAVALATLAASPARASAGLLAPPHADFGLDPDADTLWDYLVVSVHVDVTTAGGFIVLVQLSDGTGTTNIATGQSIMNLQTGPSAVDVRIPGYRIRQSGFDGPYQARIILLNDTFAFLDIGLHITGAYLAADFEPAPATLRPPHADAGIDTDGNTQFDYLQLDVGVDVAQAGEYTVNSALTDSPPTTSVTFARNATYLPAGATTVRLRFSGADIRASGVNGPYDIWIDLLNAAGLTLDSGVHTTGTYFISDFDALDGLFAPPHQSFAVDLDGDLFYDYLVVNAFVTVAVPGYYAVDASIPAIPLSMTKRTFLPAGTHLIQLDFLGVDLFNGGVDGPYTVDLTLRDDRWRAIDVDTFATATYFAVDFEPSPPARWMAPTTDSGRDDQPDGLWDWLLINATIDVARTAEYSWTAELWDSTFTFFITAAGSQGDLGRGLNTVETRVPGLDVSRSGIDGPYGVNLYLYDEDGRQIDLAPYTTGSYLAADFQPAPGQLTPPYVDLALDRDADTILDVIAIDVPVTVTAANTFIVTGILIDSGFSAVAFNQVIADLNPGLSIVRLLMSAADAFRSGQDGAFFAILTLSVLYEGTAVSIDNDQYITRNYTAAPFDRGAPVKISGRITAAESGAGVDAGGVILWSSAARVQRSLNADASGYYEAWVPRGEYIVLADSPSRNAMAVTRSVTADTIADFALDVTPADTIAGAMRLSAWDRGTLSGDFTIVADVAMTRLEIDAGFGDGDGFASQSELDRLFDLGAPPQLPATTRDMFTVDGVAYDRVNGTESIRFTGAGPVVSALPLRGNVSADYAAEAPILRAPAHLVRFLADYDTPEEAHAYAADWPANYALSRFDPAAGVTITGIGGATATIDPAVDPAPRDFVRDVWVNLTVSTTDTTPPLVTAAALDGQATLRTQSGPAVTVTATASDAGRGDWTIAGANHTRGARNWPTATAMSASDGAFDEVTEGVIGALPTTGLAEGSYSICVYAWDVVPNGDTAGACATLIVDDSPPSVSNVRINGQAARTVVVGTTVALTATVSDTGSGGSSIASANYTRGAGAWPGTAMTAVDGALNEPSEDVTATVDTTGWTAGTYDLCAYGTDEVGNAGPGTPACAQLTVLDADVTPPSVTDLRAQPNPADPGDTVNLSALVTDNVGVDAVYVEIFDASGASVANLTAAYDTGTGRYVASRVMPAGGTFTYRVSARDASGNWATQTGSFTVTSPPGGGPGLADYWWIFLVAIVAAVAVVAFFVWSRRKRTPSAMAPTAPPLGTAPPPEIGPTPPAPSPQQPPPSEPDPIDMPPPPPPA